MDSMFVLDVVSRILHISTAICLVGGSVFMAMVLIPSANTLESTVHQALNQQVVGRWKRFIHVGILLFLVTGFYNFIRAIPLHKGDGLYHALIGTKILLALGLMFLASVLVGRSPKFQAMRDNRAFWLKIVILLALVIVCISGFAKVRPSLPASESNVENVEPTTANNPPQAAATLTDASKQ